MYLTRHFGFIIRNTMISNNQRLSVYVRLTQLLPMDYNGASQKKGQQSVDPFCLLQTTVLTFSVGYSKNRKKGSMAALQIHSENVTSTS